MGIIFLWMPIKKQKKSAFKIQNFICKTVRQRTISIHISHMKAIITILDRCSILAVILLVGAVTGRQVAVRMNLQPRQNYLFSARPVFWESRWFNSPNQLLINSIWKNQRAGEIKSNIIILWETEDVKLWPAMWCEEFFLGLPALRWGIPGDFLDEAWGMVEFGEERDLNAA